VLEEVPLIGDSDIDPVSALAGNAPALSPTLMTRTIGWVRDHRLLPEAYLWGFAHTYKFSRRRAAFLDGEFSHTGWRRFFPLTFWYKSTPAELALFAAGILAFAASLRRDKRSRKVAYIATPLLTLFLLYWAVALNTKLNTCLLPWAHSSLRGADRFGSSLQRLELPSRSRLSNRCEPDRTTCRISSHSSAVSAMGGTISSTVRMTGAKGCRRYGSG
jgi:hypothetical protein